MKSTNPIIVVGSGPSGLVAALLAAHRFGGENVLLLEEAPRLGGLWRSFDYGANGRFDHGMHNYFECGVPEIDDFFFGFFKQGECRILEGADRDFAGVFYQNRLQANSPSIDLRNLEPSLRARCLAEVLNAAAQGHSHEATRAIDFAQQQWGPTIAEKFIAPILERQFAAPADELGKGAVDLTALRRVILLDEPEMRQHMESPEVRARLAYPEQRNLPKAYSSSRRGLYPAVPGLEELVSRTVNALKALGVQIACGKKVAGLEIANGRVSTLRLGSADETEVLPCAGVIWSAGLRSLSGLLGYRWSQTTPGRSLTLVHVLSPEPLNDRGLHYFYCYEPGLATFRVTCYRNYCLQPITQSGMIPYGMELLDVPNELAFARAIDELERFGLVSASQKASLVCAGSEAMGRAFPMPTLANEANFHCARKAISDQKFANVSIVGSMATPGLFFQPDVLRHAFATLNEFEI